MQSDLGIAEGSHCAAVAVPVQAGLGSEVVEREAGMMGMAGYFRATTKRRLAEMFR